MNWILIIKFSFNSNFFLILPSSTYPIITTDQYMYNKVHNIYQSRSIKHSSYLFYADLEITRTLQMSSNPQWRTPESLSTGELHAYTNTGWPSLWYVKYACGESCSFPYQEYRAQSPIFETIIILYMWTWPADWVLELFFLNRTIVPWWWLLE